MVYPDGALLNYGESGTPIYYIDPKPVAVPPSVHVIAKKASEGVADLIEILKNS